MGENGRFKNGHARVETRVSWWTFRFFFFLAGEGKGDSPEAAGEGVGFLLKILGGRGILQEGAAANWGILGGGLNIFFFGAEKSTKETFKNTSVSKWFGTSFI